MCYEIETPPGIEQDRRQSVLGEDLPGDINARWQAIAQHHTPLTRASAEVLVLEALGFEVTEIAVKLSKSVPTVRHHAHRARADAVPPELLPTRGNATLWVALHRRCCVAEAFTALGVRARGQN